MSTIPPSSATPITLKVALALGRRGFRVLPIKPLSKEPAISRWPELATSNTDQLRTWFAKGEFGIGLATGLQPNGKFVVVIDVDTHHGGEKVWQDFVVESGLDLAETLTTVVHRTPNAGWHIFYEAEGEELRNSRARIGPGIDTRAEGGFVVIPPTRCPDVNGEVQQYLVWNRQALWTTDLVPLPPEIAARLTALAPVSPPERRNGVQRPSGYPQNGWEPSESPFDWLRDNWSWDIELAADGWRFVKSVGGDGYYARPGKTDRGHSAVVHASGAFVVFSTEAPPELERMGTPTRDGTGYTVSPGDYFAAMRHGGDRTAAARAINGMRGLGKTVAFQPSPPPVELRAPVTATGLDDEFWGSRPFLAHIREAARSRLVAPGALLVNVLARTAAQVPPAYRLPGIVGSEATFDFMGAVVAETGGGKSIASACARDLMPVHEADDPADQQVMMDYPIGSGEGVAQAFMVPERKPNEAGKLTLTGRQIVGKQALHIVVDEGTGLVNQSQRKGTTILSTLASAWSGAALGATNASEGTKRLIRAKKVRVVAVLNMQSSNAHLLFADEFTNIGFTGRVLFGSAHDPDAPEIRDLPRWPGPLPWAPPPGMKLGTVVLEYAPEIEAELLVRRDDILKGRAKIDKQESQYTLLQCKVAGLLALWEDRRIINNEDWALAGSIITASRSILAGLSNLRSQQLAVRSQQQAADRGQFDAVVETAKERRLIATMADKIRDSVPPEGVAAMALKRRLTSGTTRHRFDAALDLAEANGFVRIEEDGQGTVGRILHRL